MTRAARGSSRRWQTRSRPWSNGCARRQRRDEEDERGGHTHADALPSLHCPSPLSPRSRQGNNVSIQTNPITQDVYAAHLGRDDAGAIAAFLDGASTRVLAASVAVARAPGGGGGGSGGGSGGGQLQVRLSNSAEWPPGCHYQIVLVKPGQGPLRAEDVPRGVRVVAAAASPAARCVLGSGRVSGVVLQRGG